MLCLTMSDCLSDFLFFKQKTAYEMRISDWSSDVCSSDLPDAVPAGKYAKAALTALGVWSSVAARLAPAENVRAAMALVERGAAPLGIVYATDARASRRVRVVGVFPPPSHPPIRYPVALLVASTHPHAASIRPLPVLLGKHPVRER